MNINKEARKDAYEYARALMFYGEGAGTRRKLLKASIDHKIDNVRGYALAYQEAFQNQDMSEHASAARKERMRKDVSKKVGRNVRGLITGNRQSLTTGVAVISVLVYVARQTGYDKKIEAYVKVEYRKTKRWAKIKHAEWKLKRNP